MDGDVAAAGLVYNEQMRRRVMRLEIRGCDDGANIEMEVCCDR